MKSKILVNVNAIRAPLTGIGYYTLNIVKALISKDTEVVGIRNGMLLDAQALRELLVSFDSQNSKLGSQGKLKALAVRTLQTLPGVYKIKKHLIELRAEKILKVLSQKGYVYFEPSFIPLKYNGPTITTIHDLSFLSHPDFHPKQRVDFLESEIEKSIDNSNHVVVDSDFILKELRQSYPQSISKSSTLYLGVEPAFRPYERSEVTKILARFGLGYKGFILSVATLEPRKNLTRLIEAYSRLPATIRTTMPLVLAGGQGWKMKELLSSAEKLHDANQIIFTGYLADKELKHLYSAARLFAYPSLYEGFGLPVVEAMASGTPVLTSKIGATAEISGESAMLVDPYCVKDIHFGLEKVLSDSEFAKALGDSALAYVRRYSWASTADRLLEIATFVAPNRST